MTADDRIIETLVSARLRAPAIPEAEDVWRRLADTCQRERASIAKRRAFALYAAIGLVTLLVLTAGLAIASPDVRAWLGSIGVAVGGSPRGVSSLYPSPPFTVLQPSALPDGWTLVANGYNPGPTPSGTTLSWSAAGSAVTTASR